LTVENGKLKIKLRGFPVFTGLPSHFAYSP